MDDVCLMVVAGDSVATLIGFVVASDFIVDIVGRVAVVVFVVSG